MRPRRPTSRFSLASACCIVPYCSRAPASWPGASCRPKCTTRSSRAGSGGWRTCPDSTTPCHPVGRNCSKPDRGTATKMSHKVYVDFPGRMVMIGFGSIGQGVLPLILRHVGIPASRIVIVTADEAGRAEAEQMGVRFIVEPLVRENYRRVLDGLLGRGDFLVNLSVDVSSVALIKHCWERGAMYIDTCVEPWAGGYTDPTVPPARRTNYALREEALALRTDLTEKKPTAVITHGANPGLVSHFVKAALLSLKHDVGVQPDKPDPATREEWAGLARALNVKVIHIAERDTQVSSRPKEVGEFVNTWSVEGFVSEGCKPAEIGWGAHDRNCP